MPANHILLTMSVIPLSMPAILLPHREFCLTPPPPLHSHLGQTTRQQPGGMHHSKLPILDDKFMIDTCSS